MPHYVPNEYPNIFGGNIFTKRISECIRIPEIARIRIVFEGHFIRIFQLTTDWRKKNLKGLTNDSSK